MVDPFVVKARPETTIEPDPTEEMVPTNSPESSPESTDTTPTEAAATRFCSPTVPETSTFQPTCRSVGFNGDPFFSIVVRLEMVTSRVSTFIHAPSPLMLLIYPLNVSDLGGGRTSATVLAHWTWMVRTW